MERSSDMGVISIKDLSVGSSKSGHLNIIDLTIKDHGIFSIICSKDEGRLLALSLQGRLWRLKGDIYINESLIPSSPNIIFRKLRTRINRNIKYVDLNARTLLSPNIIIKKNLFRILKKEHNYSQIKKEGRTKLNKKILLIIAQNLSNDKEKQFLIKNASIAERKFYAKRNIVHLKQLLTINKWAKFICLMRVVGLWKEWREIKGAMYKVPLDITTTEHVAKLESSFNKRINMFYNTFKDKKLILKQQRKRLREEIREERVFLVKSMFATSIIKKIIKKNQTLDKNTVKFHKKKFMWFDNYEIDYENNSIFITWVKRAGNMVFKALQLMDRRDYNALWKKYEPMLKMDSKVAKLVATEINTYLDTYTGKKYQMRCSKRINELLSELQIPKHLLNERPKCLTKGEQFSISLLTGLVTDPKVIVVRDCENMDATIRGQKLKAIKKLAENKSRVVLFLTSDIEVGIEIGNYCYIIKEKILEAGTTREIKINPVHPYTRNELNKLLPYGLTNLDWHHNFENKFHSFDLEMHSFSISPTHTVYENDELVKHWLLNSTNYEMNTLKRYCFTKTKILTLEGER